MLSPRVVKMFGRMMKEACGISLQMRILGISEERSSYPTFAVLQRAHAILRDAGPAFMEADSEEAALDALIDIQVCYDGIQAIVQSN